MICGSHQLVLRIVGLRRRLAADAGEGGGDLAGRVGRLEVQVHLAGHRSDAGIERAHHREVDGELAGAVGGVRGDGDALEDAAPVRGGVTVGEDEVKLSARRFVDLEAVRRRGGRGDGPPHRMAWPGRRGRALGDGLHNAEHPAHNAIGIGGDLVGEPLQRHELSLRLLHLGDDRVALLVADGELALVLHDELRREQVGDQLQHFALPRRQLAERGSGPFKRSTGPFKHGTSTSNRGPNAFKPGQSAFEPGPSAFKHGPTPLDRVHGFG